MPLTKCPDCQKDISTEAVVCLNCGRPTGKQASTQKKLLWGLTLWFTLVIVFLALWQALNQPK
jgi:predicted amidophosphoribosyltransferase